MTDYYSLDDTMAGRVLVALLNAFDEEPDNDPAVMLDQLRHSVGDTGTIAGPDSESASEISIDSPAQTWAIIDMALLVILAIGRLDAVVQKRIVTTLRARGCRRPHTLVSGISATVIFAISEVAHHHRMEKTQ